MASIVWNPRWSSPLSSEPTQHRQRSRPLPLRVRTYSEAGLQNPAIDDLTGGPRTRHKSTCTFDDAAQRSPRATTKTNGSIHPSPTRVDSPRTSLDDATAGAFREGSVLTPPTSPLSRLPADQDPDSSEQPEVIEYDFSRLDYELDRAKVLGQGLWSTVYLAEQKASSPLIGVRLPTPPATPERPRINSAPGLYAVKTPARQDAKEIFRQEARLLSRLQREPAHSQYIIPFFGLDPRNHALVFEAVLGGSLESLVGRLKHMTEVARHLELISVFPGIAFDLISGLDFLHTSGIIHADIKPANVLLDISEHCDHATPVIRARYIDFSASFMPEMDDSASNAGGTWDMLAPEQMRIQKEWSTPTFASDVWSLGLTLLWVLVGGSPYAAACGNNRFILREAIKSGDPLGFARMDAVPQKRLAACQDFVDCCRLALRKDREKRITAKAWVQWMEDQQLGA